MFAVLGLFLWLPMSRTLLDKVERGGGWDMGWREGGVKRRAAIQIFFQFLIIFATLGMKGAMSDYYVLIYGSSLYLFYDSMSCLPREYRVLNALIFFGVFFSGHRGGEKLSRKMTKGFRLNILTGLLEDWIDLGSQLEMFEEEGLSYDIYGDSYLNASLAQMYWPKTDHEQKQLICQMYANFYEAISLTLATTGFMPGLDFVFLNVSRTMTNRTTYLEGDTWEIVKAVQGIQGSVGFNLEDSKSFDRYRSLFGYSVADLNPKFYLDMEEHIYHVCKKQYNKIHGGEEAWTKNARILSNNIFRSTADPWKAFPAVVVVVAFVLGMILINDEFQKIYFRATFEIETPLCNIYYYTVTLPLQMVQDILSFLRRGKHEDIATANSKMEFLSNKKDYPKEGENSYPKSLDESSMESSLNSLKKSNRAASPSHSVKSTDSKPEPKPIADSVLEGEKTERGRVSRNSRRPSIGLFTASKYIISDVESAPPPGVHPGSKPCYEPGYPLMFASKSQSPYTALEEKKLKGLTDTLATPAKFWVRIPTRSNLSIFNLTRVPISVVQGSLVKYKYSGGAIGFVPAPLVHTASFIWDFNTEYRQKLNMKNDLVRECEHSETSDHSMKIFNRKWLPTPFYPRDFYLKFNWKRLDQKRVVIFCYDCTDEEYNQKIENMAKRGPPVNSNKIVKGGNTTVMLLEEVDGKGGGDEKATKISMASVIDIAGLLPGWLVRQRRELFFTLIGETAFYFSNLKTTMSMSNPNLAFTNYATTSQIIRGGAEKKMLDVNERTLDGKKESFPANVVEAEIKSTPIEDSTKQRIPLPNTYTKAVGLEPEAPSEAIQYDDQASYFSVEGVEESDNHSDSSKNSDLFNYRSFGSSFFAGKKKQKLISFVKYMHNLSRKMVGQLGFEGILEDDILYNAAPTNRNTRHLINSFGPIASSEMSDTKLQMPYFLEIFVQRMTYEKKQYEKRPENQHSKYPSAFAYADEEYTQFKYFVVSQNIKARMLTVLLLVIAATVTIASFLCYYSDALYSEVWVLVDLLLPMIFMTGVVVIPITLITSHLSHSSQFINAKTSQSPDLALDGGNVSEVQEKARHRMMASSNFVKEILTTMAFVSSVFYVILHLKSINLWVTHFTQLDTTVDGVSLENNNVKEDTAFDMQCLYFLLFTAPVWILLFVLEPLYQFLPTRTKNICIGAMFLAAAVASNPFGYSNPVYDETNGQILEEYKPLVDYFASYFLLIVYFLIYDINLVRAFSMRVNFSLLWNNHYNKFFHSSAKNLNEKFTWRTKQNFAVLEAILSKRRHLLHKKMAKSLDVNELEYLSHVGKGSSANVSVARYRDNIVAVKELDPSIANVIQMAKFLAEMELMANLQHPNIMRFEGLVMTCPKLCMVMEYAKEGSLRDVLRRNPFLDWRNEKRNLAYCVASGMEYLHGLNNPVLHKDLKTMNVLVTEWRGVKISDFGESGIWGFEKQMSTEKSSSNLGGNGKADYELELDLTHNDLVGTRLFMAPEVFKGENYTKECDVYSYGCLLADIALSGKFGDLFWQSGKEMFGGSLEKSIVAGWRPEIPKEWKSEFPVIYSLIISCWDEKPELRPTFNQIAISLDAWNGEQNLSAAKNDSDFVLREITDATDEENSIISQGIKHIFQKIKIRNEIGIFRIDDISYKFEGTFTHKINHPAWEVCELAFDWTHPEKMRRAWENGDTLRKTLYRINEHHHICSFRWSHRVAGVNFVNRDFVFHNIWQEISQGNYIVQYVSCDYPWQHNPEGKRVTRGYCSATLWVQQTFDGKGCYCSFTSAARLNGALNNIKISPKKEMESIRSYLHFLEDGLERKERGEWARYKDPNFVDPFYTANGVRVPNPDPEELEYLNYSQHKQTDNTRVIHGPFSSTGTDETSRIVN
ncbi:hypothetical protein TrLO_g14095 [Triparma laevis f. longispina]|nr:hypothetical protein TrLO_g14095 [Triparma laevis f. longispina]